MEHVLVELQIDAPAERVRQALRDPALIRRWHGWDYPGLEDEIGAVYGEAAVEEEIDGGGRLLRFAAIDTIIGFEPHDAETTTVWLSKTTEQPPSVSEYNVIDQGWITFLQQLRFGLQGHDLAERHTLHLDADRGTPMTLDVLGLGRTALMPIGEAYFGVLPWRQTVTGRIWFRSAFQTGLTLDDHGPGLLVVTARPTGGGKLILTSYAGEPDFAPWSEWFADFTAG